MTLLLVWVLVLVLVTLLLVVVVVVVGGGGCRYDGWCTKYVVVLVVHIVGYFVVVCGLPGS